jgi:hypothetical protein
VSLDLIIEIKKTSFPPCGIYGNQFYASLDPKLKGNLFALRQEELDNKLRIKQKPKPTQLKPSYWQSLLKFTFGNQNKKVSPIR